MGNAPELLQALDTILSRGETFHACGIAHESGKIAHVCSENKMKQRIGCAHQSDGARHILTQAIEYLASVDGLPASEALLAELQKAQTKITELDVIKHYVERPKLAKEHLDEEGRKSMGLSERTPGSVEEEHRMIVLRLLEMTKGVRDALEHHLQTTSENQ